MVAKLSFDDITHLPYLQQAASGWMQLSASDLRAPSFCSMHDMRSLRQYTAQLLQSVQNL